MIEKPTLLYGTDIAMRNFTEACNI